jgi:ribosomal small subunit protein bTHX
MGKGDVKSKKGKIARGSYGVKRQRPKSTKKTFEIREVSAPKIVEKAVVEAPKAKKPAAKKVKKAE